MHPGKPEELEQHAGDRAAEQTPEDGHRNALVHGRACGLPQPGLDVDQGPIIIQTLPAATPASVAMTKDSMM